MKEESLNEQKVKELVRNVLKTCKIRKFELVNGKLRVKDEK